jgi:hypothetical protein
VYGDPAYRAIRAGQRLVRFGGRALDAANQPVTGVAGVTFAIYEEQSGGTPLWQETQNLTTDANGRFSALLGSGSATGIPVELFSSGEARWLAVLTHSPGTSEQPRVLLVSVPYAIQASNAETLSGLPASAFVRVGETASGSTQPISAVQMDANPSLTTADGTANYLPFFSNTAGVLNNSLLYQSGSNLGVGTTTPAFNMDVISQTDPAAIAVEGYGVVGINFIGRRAEGTQAAPSALLTDDNIMAMQGRGYGKTGFSQFSRSYMKFFAAENWSDTAQGTYIGLGTTTKGTAPSAPATERVRIDDRGYVGIGTTSPDQMLTVNGSIHSTAGGIIFPDGSVMSSAATASGGVQQGGNLILPAGNGTGGAGNLVLQTVGDATGTMTDRLLIAGTPKAMSGAVPMANLFSLHIPAGEAAGGRVKFTIVASDGVNYAMETGEMIYLANPKQFSCAVVLSQYAVAPPGYTNSVLAVPAIGQSGSLNAQCSYATFGGDPGVQIFDTAPTSFTATTHKVYYTIENQSQAAITLQP